jgi:hypothetical protein
MCLGSKFHLDECCNRSSKAYSGQFHLNEILIVAWILKHINDFRIQKTSNKNMEYVQLQEKHHDDSMFK